VSILNKFRSAFTLGKKGSESDLVGADAAVENEARDKPINVRGGTRVLIVDDSPTIVFALKKMLQSAGLVTMEAADARLALSIARAGIPDLIFLDIILPGDNGFSVLRTLRKDPSTAHIPVIMMSGNEQATQLFYGGRTGADDFMKKPFSPYDVFSRIERLLDADLVPRRVTTATAPSAPEPDLQG
jgi:twitching motility two-component system response regulator PilH